MMETEFDLKDYSFELDCREQSEALAELKEEKESSLHPLARRTQPYDWCQALQLTS